MEKRNQISKPAKQPAETVVLVGEGARGRAAKVLSDAKIKARFLGYSDSSTTTVAFRVRNAAKAQEVLWANGFGWVGTTTLKALREAR
jgi:hypothetical protein